MRRTQITFIFAIAAALAIGYKIGLSHRVSSESSPTRENEALVSEVISDRMTPSQGGQATPNPLKETQQPPKQTNLTAPAVRSPPNQEPMSHAKAGHLKLLGAEQRLKNNLVESDIDSFLASVRVDNIVPEFHNSAVYTYDFPPPAALLSGRYQGQVFLQDGTNRIWNATMEILGSTQSGYFSGKEKFIISENGKVFSDQNNSGDLTGFRRSVGGSQAILVQASPTEYFQLYYLGNLDKFVGNLYEKASGSEEYTFKGTTILIPTMP